MKNYKKMEKNNIFNLLSAETLSGYSVERYKNDIDNYGLNTVWESIIGTIKRPTDCYGVLSVSNFGELYEIGLAHVNKTDKKEHGKYYTPDDVANLMSEWFAGLRGNNVCDVCCGTGNLTIAYLNKIGTRRAKSLLKSGKLFLYDLDELALTICKASIRIIYGKEYAEHIHTIVGDFLSNTIHLPENCKVISNPPYFKIAKISSEWTVTDVISDSREFYSAIMEKIMDESTSSVIITPYSFISGEKFYSLRKKMNTHNGFIVSFDNIPGNIFIGKKHGIFNSNSKNSVRAAITVTENKGRTKGFRCSNLIRFKNEERSELLNPETLSMFLGREYQVVSDKNKKYKKCSPELEDILSLYEQHSVHTLTDVIDNDGKYKVCVPNTCRYYSVAAVTDLKRTGKNTLSFSNRETRDLVYCFINSSFCYWYWRLYDGGIAYALSLLTSFPFVDTMSTVDRNRLLALAQEMQSVETANLSYKKNAGKMQENIKFPSIYRTEINNIILRCIGSNSKSDVFDRVHANFAFCTSRGGESND